MKYLIVDDEAAARRDLEKVLRRVEKDARIWQASNAAAALKLCLKEKPDVVFVDIRMPQQDGLSLAEEMKRAELRTNIIITTAYPEYALEAHSLYVSGYLLKPVMEQDLLKALQNLRMPVYQSERSLYVQCFGSFEVFYDGRPLRFGRSKAKELFAYLIDRRGAAATNAECCAILWEDDADGSGRQRDYFHHIWSELKNTMESIGYGDVLSYNRNAYSIRPDRIRCDYFAAESGNALEHGYEGEYMSQYSWAEERRPN